MVKVDLPVETNRLSFSAQELPRRHRRIRELMQKRGLDCLVISGRSALLDGAAANLRYVIGDYNIFLERAQVVFPLVGEPMLYVTGSGGELGPEVTEICPFSIQMAIFKKVDRGDGYWIQVRDFAATIAERLKELNLEKGNIGIVSMKDMNLSIYLDLVKECPQANFQSAGDLMLEARLIYSPEEQEFIRRAGEIGDKAVEAIVDAAHPGGTEAELLASVEYAVEMAGAEQGNFLLIDVAPWEEREKVIYPITFRRERKLQKGDLIMTEFEPNYQGYFNAVCIPIMVGDVPLPKGYIDLYKLHLDLYHLATEELRPGNSVMETERKMFEYASRYGTFGLVWCTKLNMLGEGLNKLDTEFVPGMSFVNQPWTEPPRGVPGYRAHIIGNTFIITDGAPECVNKSPLETIVVK